MELQNYINNHINYISDFKKLGFKINSYKNLKIISYPYDKKPEYKSEDDLYKLYLKGAVINIDTKFRNSRYFFPFIGFLVVIGIALIVLIVLYIMKNDNTGTLIDFKKSNKMITSPTSKVGPSSRTPSCNIIYNSNDISGSCISSNLYTINTGESGTNNINIPEGNNPCTFTCNSGIITNNNNSDYTLDSENPNLLNFNCGYEGTPIQNYDFICSESPSPSPSPSP